eukprot:4843786-Amphidinium_carterae.1
MRCTCPCSVQKELNLRVEPDERGGEKKTETGALRKHGQLCWASWHFATYSIQADMELAFAEHFELNASVHMQAVTN